MVRAKFFSPAKLIGGTQTYHGFSVRHVLIISGSLSFQLYQATLSRQKSFRGDVLRGLLVNAALIRVLM
jgi:hypothetical protein